MQIPPSNEGNVHGHTDLCNFCFLGKVGCKTQEEKKEKKRQSSAFFLHKPVAITKM